MPARDISHNQHECAIAALEDVRASYGRYLDVVEAQRIALQQEDMRLIARLSEKIDTTIAEVRARSKNLAPIYPILSLETTDGPRAQELRDLMTAVAAEAALAQAAQRDLTRQMIARRNQAARELDQLERDSLRTSSPYSRQPALVDASA
jgi:hypothetical protein